MIQIILYFSNGLIIFAYLYYLFLILIGRNKKINNADGFEVTKDIISHYNSINVIESNSYFTLYNIRRKVIKLATKCYYGKDLSSISLSLMEAGISAIDDRKNKAINIFSKVIHNLKVLYILPIIVIFINNFSFSINDSKIGMVFILLFSLISYVILNIKSEAVNWIGDNLKRIKSINKDERLKIINFMNKFLIADKLIYFGELIVVIRLVFIMLNIA